MLHSTLFEKTLHTTLHLNLSVCTSILSHLGSSYFRGIQIINVGDSYKHTSLYSKLKPYHKYNMQIQQVHKSMAEHNLAQVST